MTLFCQFPKIKFFNALLSILFLAMSFTSSALAQDLNWQIGGVPTEIKDSINKRLVSVRVQLGKSVTQTEAKQFTENAEAQTRLGLQPYGYFHPTIRVHLQQRRNFIVSIAIVPGVQTRWSSVYVAIIGSGQSKNQFLDDYFKIKKNAPMIIPEYQQAKSRLFSELQTEGYVKAKTVKNSIIINRSTNRAELVLVIDTGPCYYFGDIRFSATPLSPKLLNRYINFKPGDPFSSAVLLKLQDALIGSHYFLSVDVDPLFEKTKGYRVPIQVTLRERKSKLYLAGIGYSTDIGPRATLGIDWRRVNSLGHRLQALVRGSLRYYDLQARYMIPGKNPDTDVIAFSSAVFHHKVGQTNSNGFIGGVNSTREWNNFERTWGLQFLRETSFAEDVEQKTTSWLYPSFTLKKIHADNEINTNSGYHILFTTQGASKRLLANTDFWQAQLDGKWIHTFEQTKTRVLAEGLIGGTWVNDIRSLAPALQFFGGGTQSLRGFEYQGLGPGKYTLLGRLELQQTFHENWAVAAFLDVGDVFNTRNDFLLKKSVGLGLVRRSPVGSINIGFAKALDHAQKGGRLIISFGPDL